MDNYGGFHVNMLDDTVLPEWAAEGKMVPSDVDSVWFEFPLPCSIQQLKALPAWAIIGSNEGDLIYDHHRQRLLVWQWLAKDKPCTIPSGATHNMGGCAMVLDPVHNKVLLVANKRRAHRWNLPGGYFDAAKDRTIEDTALREACEESTLPTAMFKSENRMVIRLSFPCNPFAPAINEAWYFTAPNASTVALGPLSADIEEVYWARLDEILHFPGTHLMNGRTVGDDIVRACQAILMNRGLVEGQDTTPAFSAHVAQ